MCFTVAILREGVLMTAEDYYASLPIDRKKNKFPTIPEFPNMYMAYGFDNPDLPILTDKGLTLNKWGLIPSWTHDLMAAKAIRNKTLNAKGETIFELPSFRNNIINHRCILPVTGFYENQDFNAVKYPYYIQSSISPCFYIGAIYDTWINNQNGETINSFSIITTAANPLLETIHNTKKRMPLILNKNDAQIWLDTEMTKKEHIIQLIKPYDEQFMKAHTISKFAVNPHNNRNIPEITKEAYYPELTQQTLF
ncbi:MAG: SOS response-associated peptidase [Paludibacter sp.]